MGVDFIMKGLILLAVALAGLSTTLILKMKPDNVIEQIAEEVIQEETGLTVDLTPDTSTKLA